MSNTNRSGTTDALIKSVLALIGTARDDPRYATKAQAVLELCRLALNEINAPQDKACGAATPPIVSTPPGNLGLRIADLAAHGKGVREIARLLGVNASTVSRRLRNTRAKGVACDT